VNNRSDLSTAQYPNAPCILLISTDFLPSPPSGTALTPPTLPLLSLFLKARVQVQKHSHFGQYDHCKVVKVKQTKSPEVSLGMFCWHLATWKLSNQPQRKPWSQNTARFQSRMMQVVKCMTQNHALSWRVASKTKLLCDEGQTCSAMHLHTTWWRPIIGGSQETGTPRAIQWFCKVSCPRKQNGNLLKLMPELLQDFLTMKSKYIQTDWWFVLWIQVITGAFRWLICFQTIRTDLVLTLCINALAAWMHGFKEGWASTMDRVVSVPKIDQQGCLRMWCLFRRGSTCNIPLEQKRHPLVSALVFQDVGHVIGWQSLQCTWALCISASSQLTAVKDSTYTFLSSNVLESLFKSAHTALAVKACLLGGKTATLNAQWHLLI